MALYNTDFTHYNSYHSYDSYDSYDSYHSYDSYDSYDSYCDSAQIEPPIPQSSDEPTIYNLFDYPTHYFGQPNLNESPQLIDYEPVDHGYSISFTANSCSASSYSVPTVIEYDPDSYAESYQKVTTTQFAISYSVVSEFNEVEFEEYDPTPYGGGYDISETYGKPLQPSIQICYPKNGTVIAIPKAPIEEQTKQSSKTEEIESKETTEEVMEEPLSKTKPTQIEKDGDKGSEESKETVNSLADSGSGYGNYGRELNQIPSGYGLEAADLCESLFGHWPCLSRIKRQTACARCRCHGHCYCYGNYGNQWQGAADYLFGSHNPYPDGKVHGHGVYGYQRRNQGEPVHGYVWLNGFNQNV